MHAGGTNAPEDEITYGKDVDDAHDHHYDARRDDDAPEGESERLLTRCFLVQVSENAHADNYHERSEGNEAGRDAQERPIASIVSAEKREFGDDEKH